MLKKVDHIAVAVSSADDALKVFDEVFGLKADHRYLTATHRKEQYDNAPNIWSAPIADESIRYDLHPGFEQHFRSGNLCH